MIFRICDELLFRFRLIARMLPRYFVRWLLCVLTWPLRAARRWLVARPRPAALTRPSEPGALPPTLFAVSCDREQGRQRKGNGKVKRPHAAS